MTPGAGTLGGLGQLEFDTTGRMLGTRKLAGSRKHKAAGPPPPGLPSSPTPSCPIDLAH